MQERFLLWKVDRQLNRTDSASFNKLMLGESVTNIVPQKKRLRKMKSSNVIEEIEVTERDRLEREMVPPNKVLKTVRIEHKAGKKEPKR